MCQLSTFYGHLLLFRLPIFVRPISYDLELTPNISTLAVRGIIKLIFQVIYIKKKTNFTELGTRQYCRDNVTICSGHKVVCYCNITIFDVATTSRQRDFNIFGIFLVREAVHCPKSRERFLSLERDVTIKTTTGKK